MLLNAVDVGWEIMVGTVVGLESEPKVEIGVMVEEGGGMGARGWRWV